MTHDYLEHESTKTKIVGTKRKNFSIQNISDPKKKPKLDLSED